MIEQAKFTQAKFTYSLLKAFENQTKMIEEQGRKLVNLIKNKNYTTALITQQ